VIGRIVFNQRRGRVKLGEGSVVAVVSAPHRTTAFETARFANDSLKATALICRRETLTGGSDWSACADHGLGHVSDSDSILAEANAG
jgi:molybdopterin synthase catalytic subunit